MAGLIKKILIATDGSSRGKKAALYGVELARLVKGEVLALFVVDVKSGCSLDECITVGTPKSEAKTILHERGEKAVRYVEELANQNGVSAKSLIAEGNAADAILKVSIEHGADVIVMGTLGVTGIDRFLIGSVAERVVRHSTIPVLTVRK